MFTLLAGNGDGDGVFDTSEIAKSDNDRTDAELLVRYNLPNKNLSLYAGGRYIKFKQELSGSAIPIYNAEIETESWAIEAGLGATVNISENGRHRFFSNFTFGYNFSDWDYRDQSGFTSSGDDDSPIIDFNAGYQYIINERFNLSGRYRIFLQTQETGVVGNVTQDKYLTIHGPELTLAITF